MDELDTCTIAEHLTRCIKGCLFIATKASLQCVATMSGGDVTQNSGINKYSLLLFISDYMRHLHVPDSYL